MQNKKINQILFSLLCISFFLSACDSKEAIHKQELEFKKNSTVENKSAIAFGKNVSDEEAKFLPVVGILNTAVNSLCSGVHIGNNIILTAGHCVEIRTKDDQVFVSIGDKLNFNNHDKTFVASAIKVHPLYNSNDIMKSVDLALIKLRDPLPEEMGMAGLNYLDGTETKFDAFIFGYGDNMLSQVATDQNPINNMILRTFTKRISIPTKEENHIVMINDNMGASCPGDSGGPMLIRGSNGWLVAGIVKAHSMESISYLKEEYSKEQYGHCGDRGFYTNVVSQLSWITTTKNELLKN